MTYRLVFADNQRVSPCPDEVWESNMRAQAGREYWEKVSGRKLIVVEDQPTEKKNG
jgi:hypothetical protein